MANTTKKPPVKAQPVPAPKKSLGKIIKILIILVVLLLLGGIGFAVGVYFKMVNIDNFIAEHKLNEYPVVGQYFPAPKTNFEQVELPPELEQPILPPVVAPVVPTPPVILTPIEEKKAIDSKELEKQMKIKQQEDAKRISKSARLYSAMKPEEAVPIINQLNDETVLAIFSKMEDEQVAKILALLDAQRSASLTEQMIKGKPISTSL